MSVPLVEPKIPSLTFRERGCHLLKVESETVFKDCVTYNKVPPNTKDPLASLGITYKILAFL
jgi:hypothetical protein